MERKSNSQIRLAPLLLIFTWKGDCGPHSLSKTAAAPIPLPMHMETTPYLLPLFLISCRRVAVHLAPVHPRGWPRAMAPPLTFTLPKSTSLQE